MATFHCTDCGQDKPRQTEGGTGYAIYADTADADALVCYACCAIRDRAKLATADRMTLYLTSEDGKHTISNWPGTLKLPATARRFRHPFAREAWCGSFRIDGVRWLFKNIGDSQIAHCRRAKG